jgi:plasmid stability protein
MTFDGVKRETVKVFVLDKELKVSVGSIAWSNWRRYRQPASGVCLRGEQLLALLAVGGDRNVAQLMVRNVDEAVVRELIKRAARRNHSAEQEHREILEQALLRPRRRSLADVLSAMPDAGEDADFERRQIDRRA